MKCKLEEHKRLLHKINKLFILLCCYNFKKVFLEFQFSQELQYAFSQQILIEWGMFSYNTSDQNITINTGPVGL